MIKVNGYNLIGFFEGLPYGMCSEHIEDYKRDGLLLERSSVLSRFDTLVGAFTSEPTYDLFTGEEFLAGLYDDGNYKITTDFIRYYKQGIVDIPEEYEEYLINELNL